MKSVVKKFFRDKGYGFIKNGEGQDIYVNANDLTNCKFLRPGVEVEFECQISSNKLVAKSVSLVHSSTAPSHQGGHQGHQAPQGPQGRQNSGNNFQQRPYNNDQPRYVMT